ncbi:hypothetical protein M422DRAFT_274269 [Sphaerobolus stellatus SS14]|uniref:Retrotransposon gag domain-containing protein n=1 Tax=Sphaerobolus stellatus (strain SS14) TaxID=990650 RepID=A0A0C9TSM4_SPHS4|nr:hypothetical protein M422DRAFT_274269 [Sphaerobolus stellatus SS14]
MTSAKTSKGSLPIHITSRIGTIARTDKAKAAVAASTGRNLRSRSQPPLAVTASSIAKISKKTLIRKRTIASPSPLRQSIILLPIEETQSARPAAGPSSIHEPEALPYIPDLTPSRSPSPSQRTRSPSPARSTQSYPTDFTITRHAIPSYQLNPSPALQFPSFVAEDNLPDSRYNSPTRSPSPTLETPSSLPSTSQNSNLETPFPSDPSSPINTFPGSPSIIPAHRMTTLATECAAMPAPGSNRAPKTFDGSEDDIADFLELFENCADDAQLPDTEKVAFIFRYLSRGQRDVFKTFEGYAELDWAVFKAAIEEAFEGAFKEKKYTRQSLIQYTRNHSAVPIKTDTELRAYQRGFQAITHYLIKEQTITEDERDHYYWFSLHENTQRTLEQQLTTTRPDHPRSKAYK